MDELDYMGENDYTTVSAIANERSDIGITASSTPTGKRGTFYQMCMDPSFGYKEFYFPSMANPNWNDEMEARARAEYNDSQYTHEILAEFGTEESGVFNKTMLDAAMHKEYYIYDSLTEIQKKNLEDDFPPTEYLYDEEHPAPYNPFRCVGIDWDQYQAASSIIVLDFDTQKNAFKVMKKVEVPRSEYSLDNAVNWVIKINRIYNPSWIFCDRGYGDYQIERLHIYGDSHPSSGLKHKVIGYQFKESIDVIDPITREMKKEPLKQFMVSQLSLTIERSRLILCPFDEVLHKQLIDYSVDHISQTGLPIYTSKNEHFVDALCLAHLAFVLNFPDITQAIKRPENSSVFSHSNINMVNRGANAALREISAPLNPWGQRKELKQIGKGPGERKGDYQKWVKIPMGSGTSSFGGRSSWGSRSGGFGGRSMW